MLEPADRVGRQAAALGQLFLRESASTSKASEPGHWSDRVFFVMEWVEGVDAHTWIDTPIPRPWAEIREVFIEAGKGLAAAHDQGIQHRDFKPANMLVGNDGRVRVADFGVAASLFELGDESEAGWFVGTPSYMAPERLEGGRGDARSDQFSFCVAMWRGLYGQRPYAGDTREELLRSIAKRELRVGRRRTYVPLWLKQVVRKGLAESPDERHADMHALLRALHDGPDGDDERRDSNFGEAVLKRYGGHLNAPRASDPRERRVGFVYGVLAMFMVTMLSVAMFGGGHAPMTVPQNQVAPAEPTTIEGPTDPVVAAVLLLIDRGEINDADRVWQAEIDERISKGDSYAWDSVRVAEALLNRAGVLVAEGETQTAEAAADTAARYGRAAAAELSGQGEPTDEADSVVERARVFVGELRSPPTSRSK